MGHRDYMAIALHEAHLAAQEGEVPIGAVLVCEGSVVAQNHNRIEQAHDALCHAEALVLHKAFERLGRWRLEDCTLYVTLEPCPMCSWAIISSRVGQLVFGADNPDYGGAGGLVNLFQLDPDGRKIRVSGGVMDSEARALLQGFFRHKRR